MKRVSVSTCIVLLLGGLVCSCSYIFANQVFIKNASDSEIVIEAAVAPTRAALGNGTWKFPLQPGQQRVLRFHVKMDSQLLIKATWPDGSTEEEGVGYFTTGPTDQVTHIVVKKDYIGYGTN